MPVIAQGYKHFYVVLVEAAGCEAAVNRGGTAKIRPLSRLGWRFFYSPPQKPGPGGGILKIDPLKQQRHRPKNRPEKEEIENADY